MAYSRRGVFSFTLVGYQPLPHWTCHVSLFC
jgi:hypothetical protein